MDLVEAQERAVNGPQKNICVIAGAGTGKTTVLVERYLHLVEEKGIDVEDVLAITFTEKAALEMKQRVLKRLSEKGLEDLRRRVESALISTIHGFCTSILRANPVEANLDPSHDVLDELTSATLLEHALQTFFSDPPEQMGEMLQLYEEDFISEAILTSLRRYRSMGIGPGSPTPLPESINRVEKILAAKKIILSQLAQDIKELTGKLVGAEVNRKLEEKRLGVLGLAPKLDRYSPDVNIIEEIRQLCKNVTSKPTKDSDPQKYRIVADTLKEIKARYDERSWLFKLDENREWEADRHRQWFHQAVQAVSRLYEDLKRDRGGLDFDDLQLKVKDLFHRHPQILEQYRGRFKAVLVDEYQDVNRLQGELIQSISLKTSLFVVGDPKQLIYEFRDADLEQFSKFRVKVEEDAEGGLYFLDTSFRSRQEILDFINPFFRELWKDWDLTFHPIDAREGLHLPKTVPSLEVIASPIQDAEKRKGELNTAREAEAAAVAERVEEIAGLPASELSKWGRAKPFGYGDMALLFRFSNSMEIYGEAFKAQGIPYTITRGSGVFRSMEFTDALSLLRVIDNAGQDIPLAALLRSPFVDVNDDTLFLLTAATRKNGITLWNTIALCHEIEGLDEKEREKLDGFTDLMPALRWAGPLATPCDLLEGALRETLYEVRILSNEEGLQRLANVRATLKFLRDNGDKVPGGLSAFCNFMETARKADFKAKEASLTPQGADTVSFITVHSAKGLEFPLVVLADMGGKPGWTRKKSRIFVSEEYGICSKHRGEDGEAEENIGYHLSKEPQDKREIFEAQRLLYVAMTRAGEHLIIAGSGKFSEPESMESANTPIHAVCAALGITVPQEGEPPFPALPELEKGAYEKKITIVEPMEDGKAPVHNPVPALAQRFRHEIANGLKIEHGALDGNSIAGLKARLDYREKALPEQPLFTSITGLLEYRQCPARFLFKHRFGIPEEGPVLQDKGAPVSGAELGSSAHRVLSLMDFEDDLAHQAPHLLRATGMEMRFRDEIEKLVHNFVDSDLYGTLRAAKKLHRELPFSMEIDGSNLSGVMDLLFQRDDGGWDILDYKTDAVGVDATAARAENYFFQLRLYALATNKIFGVIPRAVMLYFLRPNIILEQKVTETDLYGVEEEAAGLLESIRGQRFPLLKSQRCNSCDYSDTFCRIMERAGGLT